MYKVHGYNYPQCSAGLYSLVNCRILSLSEDFQPRKDGKSGFDAMVPLNPEKVAIAKFVKDDVRKEKYYVVILNEITWELHYSSHQRFGQEIINWHYVKGGKSYSGANPLPKVFELIRQYEAEWDVDKARKILAEIEAIPAKRLPCKYYYAEIMKCAIAPNISCSECKEYEAKTND